MADTHTRNSENRPFTVVLLYPDYAATQFGRDVYVGVGRAADPWGAVKEVQYQAYQAGDGGDDPSDFQMVAVFSGDVPLALGAYDAAEDA